MLTRGKPKARLRARAYALARLFHLYLSTVAFFSLFFFGVTGLTLNHPEWLGEGVTRRLEGRLPGAYLKGEGVDWVSLLEDLRALGARGRVEEYGAEGETAWVSFRAPGYAADFQLDLEASTYRLTLTQGSLWALLNELHQGRHVDQGWRLFIDVSALLLALSSLTGLALGLFIPQARRPTLWALGLGGMITLLLALRAMGL